MATPQVTKVGDIEVAVQSELSMLAHKHVHLSFALVGVLVLIIGLACFGGWLGLRSYEAQVARAEAAEARYDQDRKDLTALLSEHEVQRTQDAKAEAQLLAQIVKRDKQAPSPVIQTGLKPDANADQASRAVTEAFKANPDFGGTSPQADGNIGYTVNQTQIVIDTAIERDHLRLDLGDEQKAFDIQRESNISLTNDLHQCVTNKAEADKVIAQYKKAAKKSRFKRFLSGAEKALLFAGGVYVGHLL